MSRNVLVVIALLVVVAVVGVTVFKQPSLPPQGGIEGGGNETALGGLQPSEEEEEAEEQETPVQEESSEPSVEPGEPGEPEAQPLEQEEAWSLPLHPSLVWIPPDERLTSELSIPEGAQVDVYMCQEADILDWYQTQLQGFQLEAAEDYGEPQMGLTYRWAKYASNQTTLVLVYLRFPEMPQPVLIAIQGTPETLQGYEAKPPHQAQEEPDNELVPAYLPLPEEPVLFSTPPIALEDIREIWPSGNLGPEDGHVFPTPNGYLLWKNPESYPPSVEVYAPAHGFLLEILYRQLEWPPESGRSGTYNDYELIIATAKTQLVRLEHVSELSQGLLDLVGPIELGANRVEVELEEGMLLGYTGGRPKAQYTMGWKVIVSSQTHYSNPSRYGTMAMEAHFLEYCTPELRAQLMPLLIRTAEPRMGEYDYDILGTLSGNWFHVDVDPAEPHSDWEKQLSFCYHMLDPGKALISIGGTLAVPVGVYKVEEGVTPYSDVTPQSGPVLYHARGDPDDDQYRDLPKITLLVELLDEETLRVEAFQGWLTNPAFTENAQIYTR